MCRSQWPRGLRCRSAAARLLRSWVQIPPGAWMSVPCVMCCQVEVSATGWSLVQRSPADCSASCVIQRTSWMRRPWPTGGCRAKHKSLFDVCWTVRHCDNWRIKNQLDATYYFIVLLIGLTRFGHYYAHHQEFVTITLITTLVVSFLVCCRLEALLCPSSGARDITVVSSWWWA